MVEKLNRILEESVAKIITENQCDVDGRVSMPFLARYSPSIRTPGILYADVIHYWPSDP